VHQRLEGLNRAHRRGRAAEQRVERLDEAFRAREAAKRDAGVRCDAGELLGVVGRSPEATQFVDQAVPRASAPDQTRPLAMSCTRASGSLRPAATLAVKSA